MTRLLILLSLLMTATAWSQEPPSRWQSVERVVVFGDVHGAFDQLIELLQYLDVIDANNQWTGGTTHLVSLGDLLDRGPNSRMAMDLLIKLQQQAAAAGGMVHVVLGNHEVMNLTGDLRYVSIAEYAAFASEETPQQRTAAFAAMTAAGITFAESDFPPGYFAQRAAFAPDGYYGRWLLTLTPVVVINNSAFVHAGFPEWMNAYSLSEVNERLIDDLQQLLEAGTLLVDKGAFPAWHDLLDTSLSPASDDAFRTLQQSPFLGNDGPLWYRGTAYCHPLLEAPMVEQALAQFDVKRLVLGHTVTRSRKIEQRFNGKVLMADSGMLKTYYHGQPSAVVIQSGETQFAYVEEGEIVSSVLPPIADRLTTLLTPELLEYLRTLVIDQGADSEPAIVNFQGLRLQPVFTPGNKRSNANRVAAYFLDQLLGLGMVPPTVEREHKGVKGTLSLLPVKAISETQRLADNIPRSQWCAGMTDYQLMYAFDALTNYSGRTTDTMFYDQVDWSLVLLIDGAAFTTGSSFPDYLARVPAVLPLGLAEKLRELNQDKLEQALGSILSSRQIRAIENRRVRLLDTWQVTN